MSQRIRINRPFPFADCPDWAVGIVMLTFGQSRMPESRLLYAAACAEWADRQVARKLKAHVAAAAEAMNKNEPGPAARP